MVSFWKDEWSDSDHQSITFRIILFEIDDESNKISFHCIAKICSHQRTLKWILNAWKEEIFCSCLDFYLIFRWKILWLTLWNEHHEYLPQNYFVCTKNHIKVCNKRKTYMHIAHTQFLYLGEIICSFVHFHSKVFYN